MTEADRVSFGAMVEQAIHNAELLVRLGISTTTIGIADTLIVIKQVVEAGGNPDLQLAVFGVVGIALIGVGLGSFRRGRRVYKNLEQFDRESLSVRINKP